MQDTIDASTNVSREDSFQKHDARPSTVDIQVME
jgi:hypothetical protein